MEKIKSKSARERTKAIAGAGANPPLRASRSTAPFFEGGLDQRQQWSKAAPAQHQQEQQKQQQQRSNNKNSNSNSNGNDLDRNGYPTSLDDRPACDSMTLRRGARFSIAAKPLEPL